MNSNRIAVLDKVRGLAIILMMLDHTLVMLSTLEIISNGALLTRMTLTRFALPMFMIVSGALWAARTPGGKRIGSIILVSIFLNVFMVMFWSEFSTPEVLAVWALAALFASFISKYPVLAITLSYIQWEYWPIGWDGYQPGVVVLFLAVGVLAARCGIVPGTGVAGKLLPEFLGVIGKRPIIWYAGHLVVLTVLVAISR